MRERLVPLGPPLVIAAACSLAAGMAIASPTGALSCAPSTGWSPAAIASGTEPRAAEGRATEDGFFDRYDIALIGTVAEVTTADSRAPDYGAATIDVEVLAILGDDRTAPPSMQVGSSDPGWMSGYPYEVGITYFIPIQAEGPDGRPNFSFICDPIAEIDAGAVDDLRELAADAGIPFATPASDAPDTLDDPDDPDDSARPVEPAVAPSPAEPPSSSGRVTPPVVLTLTVLVAALAAATATIRRLDRRRSKATKGTKATNP